MMKSSRPHTVHLVVLGALLSSLFAPGRLSSAVFDYSAQLENILLSRSGNTILYRVFDPALGRFVEEREGTPIQTEPVSQDGLVAWISGSVVYARFYDPMKRRWIKSEVASQTGASLQIGDGVLAWSDGRLISLLVYDLARHAWKLNQSTALAPSQFQTAGGVAAWSFGPTVYLRVYDPVKGQWIARDESTPAPVESLLVRHGLVAWSSRGVVQLRTYEPAPQSGTARWITRQVESGTPSDLQADNGVVSWQNGTRVYFNAYDPMLNAWRGGEAASGPASSLTIRDGTVTWVGSDLALYIRGYDVNAERWINGMTVPFASFGASATGGEVPGVVYFYDRSLGAAGWCWEFGDGGVRAERAPYHTYDSASMLAARLTVNGPHGITSTAMLGLDFTSPGASSEVMGSNAALNSGDSSHLLEARRNDDGLLEVEISGQPGQEVTLEATSDLQNWEAIATLTLSQETVTYIDADSANLERRFYRVK